MNQINRNCRKNARIGYNVTIDEYMIPFKGRHLAKQYIPSKPTKWGFKCYVLADS